MTKAIKGIRVAQDDSEAATIKDAASRKELEVRTVNMAGITSKASLLDAIGKGLSFPNYYGHNWDALHECLRDLADTENGWIIVFEHADVLLSLPPRDAVTLASVLSDTSEFWRGRGKTFSALFVGSLNLNSALAA